MFYSLTGILLQAKDENDANRQVNDMGSMIWDYKQNCDSIKDSEAFEMLSIIETEDIVSFLKDFQCVVNDFLKKHKEKICIE